MTGFLSLTLVLLVGQCFAQPARTTAAVKPNVIFILLDDMGMAAAKWAADLLWQTGTDCKNTTFERDPIYTPTPNLNTLAYQGVILKNYYTYTTCTPSRIALMTGRLPVQVGTKLNEPEEWDGTNSTWGMEGMPTNLTIFPRLLQQRGYVTHLVGKGDGFGAVTPDHLPINRGFNSTLHYHNHANDMFDYTIGPLSVGLPPPCAKSPWNAPFVADLWDGNGPAQRTVGNYEEKVFSDRVLNIINAHPVAKPLFLYYSPHIPHTPLQLPRDWDPKARDWFGETAQQMCNYNSECRRSDGTCWLNCTGYEGIIPQAKWYTCLTNASIGAPRGVCASIDRIQYLASLRYIDEVVLNITTALKNRAMWDNTLLIFTSDNGGGIGIGPGGSNYPLRGGKGGFWEGGFRVPAFISGGAIPTHIRGTVYTPVMHVSDWYRTLVQQGDGSNIQDDVGQRAGIPQPQPYDFWPKITSASSDELRSNIHLSPGAYMEKRGSKWMKVLQGIITNTLWQGPDYPNTTCDFQSEVDLFKCRSGNPSPLVPSSPYNCGSQGCLYDITSDPGEHTPVNDPNILTSMITTLNSLNLVNYFEPWKGCPQDTLWCNVATAHWSNTYGPFVNVAGCDQCVHLTAAYWAHPTVPVSHSEADCSNAT